MRSNKFTSEDTIKSKFEKMSGDYKNYKKGGVIISKIGASAYCHTGPEHCLIDGATGTGKTSCVTKSFVRNSIEAEESIVCIDPKGDLYHSTACYAEKTHRVICIDFKNPYLSPDKWNPLTLPYEYYKMGDPISMDIASALISDFTAALLPETYTDEPYWTISARAYLAGIIYALFEKGSEEEINISSLYKMLLDGEKACGIGKRFIHKFVELFPEDSFVRTNISTYSGAPNETRGSIYSVLASGLNICSSTGLMNMLSQDTINIKELDIDEKPIAVYILLPDTTNLYDPIAAILFSQLTQHFIMLADTKYKEKNNRLPHRLSIILEELSSVGGKALPNLDALVTSSRSRNIRMMLVLQDAHTQLETLYGKLKAETINSCLKLSIVFANNNMSSMRTYSEMCGTRQMLMHNHIIEEPLISANDLASMPVGVALILAEGVKFVTKLPFYEEVFDCSDWQPPSKAENNTSDFKPKMFSMENIVNENDEMKRKELTESMFNSGLNNPFNPFQRVEKSEEDLNERISKLFREKQLKDYFENKSEHRDIDIDIPNIENDNDDFDDF